MSTMTTVPANDVYQVSLQELYESKTNPRKTFDPVKLKELAESIKHQGVLHPIVARRRQPDGYEVVVGARRFRAAHIAGLETIPVTLRELTDEQVREIQEVENLQREDLLPLEAAESFARWLEAGRDAKELALRLGVHLSYVYRMAKLAALIPPAKKLLEKGQLGVNAAIGMARLRAEDQQELVEEMAGYAGGWTEERVREWANRYAAVPLEYAPWDQTDATLVPAAGPCTTCPKRTGAVPGLFPEYGSKDDRCLDSACFDGKLIALIARLKETEGKAKRTLVAISQDWTRDGKTKPKALTPREWRTADKACPYLAAGIVVDHGATLGKLLKVCTKPTTCPVHGERAGSRGTSGTAASKASVAKAKAQREQTAMRRAALTAIVGKAPSSDVKLLGPTFWRAVGQEFYDALWAEYRKEVATMIGAKNARLNFATMDVAQLFKALIAMVGAPSIRPRIGRRPDQLGLLCKLFKVRVQDFRPVPPKPKQGKLRGTGKRKG